MQSKIRSLTVIFYFFLVVSYGSLLISLLLGNTIGKSRSEDIEAAVILGTLYIAILGYVWFTTLVITIDSEKKQIRFRYIFRFLVRSYNFSEVIGFRYIYHSGRGKNKSLQFKTTDGKKFSISNFETENLLDIENASLKYFSLRADKAFRELSEKERSSEIKRSKNHDLEKAKELRITIGIGIIILGVASCFLFLYFLFYKKE